MTYGIEDVAERYGVHPSTVKTWIRNKELRAVCVSKNPNSKKPRFCITSEALAEFEAARSTQPAVPTVVTHRRQKERATLPVGDYTKFYEE